MGEGDGEGCEDVRGVMVTIEGLEGGFEGGLKRGRLGGRFAVLLVAVVMVVVGNGVEREGVEEGE